MHGQRTRVLTGRTATDPGDLLLRLSDSTAVDLPLAAYDVAASRIHVSELERLGLVSTGEASRTDAALSQIAGEIEAGAFAWSSLDEDVHMNVEGALRERVGDELAGQLQAGRSRNEEVVTDERMWLRTTVAQLDGLLSCLQATLLRRAAEEPRAALPAHTHTQPAQPVLLAHHLLAYVEMLERDRARLADLARRADACPAGSGAIAGSGLALDRARLATALGFAAPTTNSIDAVSDRDYAAELVAACAIAAGHLSRLAGELVLWSTPYLGFARLPDSLVSGSSMLPNKRNPDAAELVRARSARCQAALSAILSLTAGLPLGYHRDFQETREPMMASAESLALSLEVVEAMVAGVTFEIATMRRAATAGHALAVGLVDRLVEAGVPFRAAHRRVGTLVAQADARGVDLSELPELELRAALPELAEAASVLPSLEEALEAAKVVGGTAPARVRQALEDTAGRLGVALPALQETQA